MIDLSENTYIHNARQDLHSFFLFPLFVVFENLNASYSPRTKNRYIGFFGGSNIDSHLASSPTALKGVCRLPTFTYRHDLLFLSNILERQNIASYTKQSSVLYLCQYATRVRVPYGM